jgi:membrane associated rhomboid family serine protease
MEALTPLVVIHTFISSLLLLPLRDNRPYKSFPIVTLILVGVNTGIFIFTFYILPIQIGRIPARAVMFTQMLVPAAVIDGVGHGALSMITAAFLHASWLHLIGNMFFLLFFGHKVEDLLGPVRFLLLYFVCIFVSGIGSVIGEIALPLWHGTVPNLGASGAIMGVVGAYLFLFNEERIRTLILVFGIIPVPYLPRMRAWVFIAYTIAGDVLNGFLEEQFQQLGQEHSSTNSFAHLSGIVAGMLCIYLFLPSMMLRYRYQPEQKKL